jgi:hypothetical protein
VRTTRRGYSALHTRTAADTGEDHTHHPERCLLQLTWLGRSTNLTDVYDHCITEKSCPGQPAYVKMHQKDGTGDKKRKSRGKGKPQAKGKQSSKGKGKGKHRAVSDGESSEALDSDSDSDSDDGSDTGTDNHGPKKRPRIDDRPVTATPLSSTVTFGKTIADLDNKSMVSKVMRSFNARDIVNDRNFAKSVCGATLLRS